jgi:CDP-4-dehydro-6-deoxyglucose reductase
VVDNVVNVKLTNGREFPVASGKSVLEAALAVGLVWPYSCKTGRCQSCKCKLLQGETTALHLEAGLSDTEKQNNWILSCVRVASTDLLLDVGDLCDVVLPLVKLVPSRISQIDRLASDVVRVQLRLPPATDFKFIPGQYIDVIGSHGLRRSYSLANASSANKQLELHIRAVDGGAMSDYWFNQAQVNDLLRINGPLGTFFLRDISGLDLIFLATGTGIAPVKAMMASIASLSPEQQPKSITVLWGGRTEEDLYLDFRKISVPHRFVPVLSKASADWVGARGYVQQVLLNLQQDLSNATVYACGSDAMIRDASVALIGAGLKPQNFYSDAFVCSANS